MTRQNIHFHLWFDQIKTLANRRGLAMKKIFLLTLLFLSFFSLVPTEGQTSYILWLKNGGKFSTPGYWVEKGWIYFYCTGGVAGIEEKGVDTIEMLEDISIPLSRSAEVQTAKVKKERESSSQTDEKNSTAEIKPSKPKIDIEEARAQKDRMTVELDALAEKMREATRTHDKEAEQKLRQEHRNTSRQIYQLTDEVKEQNEGKLPDGWWKR
jgi:hypothetical protein